MFQSSRVATLHVDHHDTLTGHRRYVSCKCNAKCLLACPFGRRRYCSENVRIRYASIQWELDPIVWLRVIAGERSLVATEPTGTPSQGLRAIDPLHTADTRPDSANFTTSSFFFFSNFSYPISSESYHGVSYTSQSILQL